MSDAIWPRKRPRQQRALETVKAILQATERLLVAEGNEATSMTRIAKVAGVSVGSLYQYFPSKASIIATLSRAHSALTRQSFSAVQSAVRALPLRPATRLMIDTELGALRSNPDLCRVLFQEILQLGHPDHIYSTREQVVQLVHAELGHRKDQPDDPQAALKAFIAVFAIDGVSQGVLHSRPHLLNDPVLLELCTDMVMGLLTAQPADPPPSPTT